MTYGERAVGLSFNPSGNQDVDMVKRLYANIIDILYQMSPLSQSPEQTRLFTVAITEAQGAQMWAVKSITYGLP